MHDERGSVMVLTAVLLGMLVAALGVITAVGRLYAEKHGVNAVAQGAARAAVTYWLNEAQRRSLDRQAQYAACGPFEGTESLRQQRTETRERTRERTRQVNRPLPNGGEETVEERYEERYQEHRPTCLDQRNDRTGASGLARVDCWRLRQMMGGRIGSGYWLMATDLDQLLGDGLARTKQVADRFIAAFPGYEAATLELTYPETAQAIFAKIVVQRAVRLQIPFQSRSDWSMPVTSARAVDSVLLPPLALPLDMMPPDVIDARDPRICPDSPYTNQETSTFFAGEWRE